MLKKENHDKCEDKRTRVLGRRVRKGKTRLEPQGRKRGQAIERASGSTGTKTYMNYKIGGSKHTEEGRGREGERVLR